MKIAAVSAVLALIILLSGETVHCYAGEDPFPEREPSFVLMEAHTGTVIEAERENERVPAGPFNKLMTLLIIMEKIETGELSEDTELTADKESCSTGGAVIWLEEGEKQKVSELLRGMIQGNAGDAAAVLARSVCSTKQEFAELMNLKAEKMGMHDTYYTGPSEVDDEEQYTTAADTALLARELSEYPQLTEMMTTWHDFIRDGKTELVNENRLVRTYRGVTGMKAGHSPGSGYSVVLSAERDEKKFISVVLGCSDEDERFSIAKKLMNRGFSGYVTVTPGFSAEGMKPLSVRHGEDRAVMLSADALRSLAVAEKSRGSLKTEIFLPEYIDAPVHAGQKVGTLAFYDGSTLLYETPLMTEKSVRKITFSSSFMKILRKLFK